MVRTITLLTVGALLGALAVLVSMLGTSITDFTKQGTGRKDPVADAYSEASVESRLIWPSAPTKFNLGEYAVIKASPETGRIRRERSLYKVTAINGRAVEGPLSVYLEYAVPFSIPGEGEVVLSGFFTRKVVGIPSWPLGSPELHYMSGSPTSMGVADFFHVTGIREPLEMRDAFLKELGVKPEQYPGKGKPEQSPGS